MNFDRITGFSVVPLQLFPDRHGGVDDGRPVDAISWSPIMVGPEAEGLSPCSP